MKSPTFKKPVKGVRITAVEMQYVLARVDDIRRLAYNARFEKTHAILEIARLAEDALAVAEGRSRS